MTLTQASKQANKQIYKCKSIFHPFYDCVWELNQPYTHSTTITITFTITTTTFKIKYKNIIGMYLTREMNRREKKPKARCERSSCMTMNDKMNMQLKWKREFGRLNAD